MTGAENTVLLSEDEEQALLERQRRRNRILGWTLAVLVIVTIIATIYLINRTGFVPMDNADVFRST